MFRTCAVRLSAIELTLSVNLPRTTHAPDMRLGTQLALSEPTSALLCYLRQMSELIHHRVDGILAPESRLDINCDLLR